MGRHGTTRTTPSTTSAHVRGQYGNLWYAAVRFTLQSQGYWFESNRGSKTAAQRAGSADCGDKVRFSHQESTPN